jgi:hypothetical protein
MTMSPRFGSICDPLRTVFLLGGAHQRCFHGFDHHIPGNAFFLADLIDHLYQFLSHALLPPE